MKGIRFYQSIQIKLIIIYVLLILIAMQLIGIYFIRTMESSFLENFTTSLNKQVNLLAEYVKPYLAVSEAEELDGETVSRNIANVVDNFNRISGAEIQIINASGVVLSSSANREIVGQKNTQTEISRALQGFRGIAWEMTDDLGTRKRAVAMPVTDGGKVLGVVYVVSSMEDLFATINRINRIFLAGTLIALGLTAILGIILSNTITAPIKEITKKAAAMAEGNFNQKVKVQGHDEIGQLASVFNHMTERLSEALSANEEEKEKLASILANMSDGVVATDQHGRVIVMNRRAEQMLKRQEKEVIGQDAAKLLGMSNDEVVRTMQKEENTVLVEQMVQEDAEPLTVRMTFTPIHRRDQGITGTIIVLQDVTEQEKLERSRREFVANVSHELRTPLTTIKSYLEALDDGAIEDPGLARKFLGVTRNETERMIRLVTDLLHLSRLDSKQTVISKEPTDVANMLEDVADRFSFQLQQRNISISIAVEEGIDTVMLDPDQIDQVLDNLVSNAIKYTSEGGSIEIRASKPNDQWIEISVTDTGIGIPEKDQGRIFERFYRVDKARSRKMGGTGLGLSIAREIVKAHGGSITLESEVNKGTKVVFTLPCGERKSEAV